MGSSSCGTRPGYPAARRIFLEPGTETMFPVLASRFPTTGPPGKSTTISLEFLPNTSFTPAKKPLVRSSVSGLLAHLTGIRCHPPLHPLTHSDSSSGTKLYYPDGETEVQNASLTVNRSRAPGLSALLGPPSLCWTGYYSMWKYFLAFNDSKSRLRHLGTSCASPDPTSTSGNL